MMPQDSGPGSNMSINIYLYIYNDWPGLPLKPPGKGSGYIPSYMIGEMVLNI